MVIGKLAGFIKIMGNQNNRYLQSVFQIAEFSTQSVAGDTCVGISVDRVKFLPIIAMAGAKLAATAIINGSCARLSLEQIGCRQKQKKKIRNPFLYVIIPPLHSICCR